MASALENQEKVRIRTALGNDERFFSWNEKVSMTYDTDFSYINPDLKLFNFARGELGTVSDCFLLYAVAVLGVSDLESIRLLLGAISRLHKELAISDMGADSTNLVRERLGKLHKAGFLCKHMYTTMTSDGKGGMLDSNVTLYSIPKSAQTFMNAKLDKNTTIQDWIQAKPVYVIEGWAACSYFAARMAQNPGFVKLSQGIFKTSLIGVNNIASVIKMKNPAMEGSFIYVGVMYAYLHYTTSIQTEEDFEDSVRWLIRRLQQFLYAQDKKKHVVRIVLMVEDNYDLVNISEFMTNSEYLSGDQNRIYFTGEGVIRQLKKSDNRFAGCFLQLVKTRTKTGYDLVPVEPDFLS